MLYRDYLKSKYQNTAVKLANAEGVPCVLKYSKGKNMRNYEVYANSVQDGTPSPESPVEIQSVGDLTTKNLINESAITLSSGYWSDSGGNQINNNSGFIRISSVKCNPNETYTLSSNLKIYTIWFFNNDTSISKTYRVNTVAVFTTPENCNSLRISLVNTSGNTDTIAFKWIQLELGSTATEYEPYHKYDIPITVTGTRSETTHIYLDEPLRKVGDCADYIDFKNQKVVRNIHKIIIDENSVIRLYPYRDMNGVYIPLILPDSEIRANGLCTYSDKVGRTFDLGSIWCGANDRAIYLIGILDILGLSTADEFIAWLSSLSIPFEIIYCRTESTEENISLPALKTFKDTSVISVDTTVLPSNIKAKYIRT